MSRGEASKGSGVVAVRHGSTLLAQTCLYDVIATGRHTISGTGFAAAAANTLSRPRSSSTRQLGSI